MILLNPVTVVGVNVMVAFPVCKATVLANVTAVLLSDSVIAGTGATVVESSTLVPAIVAMPAVVDVAAGPFIKLLMVMVTLKPGVNLAPTKSILKTPVAQDMIEDVKADVPEFEIPTAEIVGAVAANLTPLRVTMTALKPVTVVGVNDTS